MRSVLKHGVEVYATIDKLLINSPKYFIHFIIFELPCDLLVESVEFIGRIKLRVNRVKKIWEFKWKIIYKKIKTQKINSTTMYAKQSLNAEVKEKYYLILWKHCWRIARNMNNHESN